MDDQQRPVTDAVPVPVPVAVRRVHPRREPGRGDDHLVVLVCRDCCCGTVRKHPDVDHDAQFAELEAAVGLWGHGEARITGCMGQCSESNIVQVKRRVAGAHGRLERETLWFGRVLDAPSTSVLTGWIAQGCPAAPPAPLVPHLFGPSAARYLHGGAHEHQAVIRS